MENIVGLYEPRTDEPRYFFLLDACLDDKRREGVGLYLVNENGQFEHRLLSLVNKGGSWQLVLAALSDEFMDKFGENFDLDVCFLHMVRE